MPFGLGNAPATLKRLINRMLPGLKRCAAYSDDVMVFSDTWDADVQRLQAVFDQLAEANLTVNLAKCELAKATVTYLCKVAGQGEVRPVHTKVEAIDKYPVPTSKKALMCGSLSLLVITAVFAVISPLCWLC